MHASIPYCYMYFMMYNERSLLKAVIQIISTCLLTLHAHNVVDDSLDMRFIRGKKNGRTMAGTTR